VNESVAKIYPSRRMFRPSGTLRALGTNLGDFSPLVVRHLNAIRRPIAKLDCFKKSGGDDSATSRAVSRFG
jgi:hypothetical protein